MPRGRADMRNLWAQGPNLSEMSSLGLPLRRAINTITTGSALVLDANTNALSALTQGRCRHGASSRRHCWVSRSSTPNLIRCCVSVRSVALRPRCAVMMDTVLISSSRIPPCSARQFLGRRSASPGQLPRFSNVSNVVLVSVPLFRGGRWLKKGDLGFARETAPGRLLGCCG